MMHRTALAALVLCLPCFTASLVGCGDSHSGSRCTSSTDCPAGQSCLDGTCVESGTMDGGATDAGTDGAMCSGALFCGSPPVCCAEGNECLEGSCVPACASGVRCGADRSICCGAEQVCVSDACTDLGDACTDSYECPEGSFCEPTLGRCLPQFDPVTCRTEPDFGPLQPEVEWSAHEFVDSADYHHAIAAPLVVDLDGDRIPEVVATFFSAGSSGCEGVMRAMRGASGEVLWTVAAVEGVALTGCPTSAAGDLDGDGTPEIVTLGADGRVVALGADGTHLWSSRNADGTPYSAGAYTAWANVAIALADLDLDGQPEIVVGAVVLDRTGTVRWVRDGGTLEGDNAGYYGGLPAVADLDLDGTPEIVTGRRAYENDGSSLWTASVTDGYPAVGDFDDDPQPEVVLVTEGSVYLLDGADGTVEWGPVAIPGGGRGGPPTVADFDGDGAPEVGVAGGSSYSVYEPFADAPVLWSRATRDQSSNATGSAVFDFEGDGAAEVVYADECHLRAYRGSDGEVLFEVESSSGTQHEYPVVADIDGDGNAEIAVVANDNNAAISDGCRATYTGWAGQRHGLFVYGDAADRWVRTRRIWNQHTYHVTNVTPAGTIPSPEPDNWSTPGLNNYRQNAQGEGVFNAPDLTVLALEVSLRGCPEAVTLRARVGNEGTLGVAAGVPVTFRRGTRAAPGEVLGTVPTAAPLLPGASTVVELEVALEGEAPHAFVVTVDDDGAEAGAVIECDEEDNDGAIEGLDCSVF